MDLFIDLTPSMSILVTLSETNLKMDGWNTTCLLGRPIFRGYVSFKECIDV